MSIQSRAHSFLRSTPLRYYYHLLKARIGGAPQSDESAILSRMAVDCPRTFLEFGFHPTEYNCIGLTDFNGLLVDGDNTTVRLAKAVLPKRIEARQSFITLDNIGSLGTHFPKLGVLSVDVDGNDYWFLKELLPARPSVVVVEYNASFGLNPVTVPYDPAFDRKEKHNSGWFHGASITALISLCKRHGYKLVAVSAAGGNAFFLPQDSSLPELDPALAYRESTLRNRWSGTTAGEQWDQVKHMPFTQVFPDREMYSGPPQRFTIEVIDNGRQISMPIATSEIEAEMRAEFEEICSKMPHMHVALYDGMKLLAERQPNASFH